MEVWQLKLRAACWHAKGIIFHCKDLKEYFNLACCLGTIAKALTSAGKVFAERAESVLGGVF